MFVDEEREQFKEDQKKPPVNNKPKHYVLNEDQVVDVPTDVVVQFFLNKGFVKQKQAALRQIAT